MPRADAIGEIVEDVITLVGHHRKNGMAASTQCVNNGLLSRHGTIILRR